MTLKYIFKKSIYRSTGKCLHENRKEAITMDDGKAKQIERCKICMKIK